MRMRDLFYLVVSECEEKTFMGEQLKLRGTLRGHGGWVTQIATTPAVPDMILSASRGDYRHTQFDDAMSTVSSVLG